MDEFDGSWEEEESERELVFRANSLHSKLAFTSCDETEGRPEGAQGAVVGSNEESEVEICDGLFSGYTGYVPCLTIPPPTDSDSGWMSDSENTFPQFSCADSECEHKKTGELLFHNFNYLLL